MRTAKAIPLQVDGPCCGSTTEAPLTVAAAVELAGVFGAHLQTAGPLEDRKIRYQPFGLRGSREAGPQCVVRSYVAVS